MTLDFTQYPTPTSNLLTIVLKTGLDWPVRPVQPRTGSQSDPIKTPKTGENRSKSEKKKKQ